MYKVPKFKKSSIIRITEEKGDLLQTKIKRLLKNKENLDEAPLIYTEKKDGVQPQYNIRTDKWEIAIDAMDKLNTIRHAKSENRRAGKVVELNPNDDSGETKEK